MRSWLVVAVTVAGAAASCDDEYCWDVENAAPFTCGADPHPLQVLKPDGSDARGAASKSRRDEARPG